MEAALVRAHWNNAAVTSAEAASHDAFHRHLAWPSVPGSDGCRRRQHPFRTAGIDHDRRRRRHRRQTAIERRGDAAALTDAAVFSRQHELDAEAFEEVEV